MTLRISSLPASLQEILNVASTVALSYRPAGIARLMVCSSATGLTGVVVQSLVGPVPGWIVPFQV